MARSLSLSLWCSVVALLALWVHDADAVVGGAPASPPEPDAAVVFLQKRGRSARVEGKKHDVLNYYSFYGIRYAEPPMGRRRFQRPVRRYLSGEQMAVKPCLPCPQPDPNNSGQVIGHEDCLCLSVFAPKMPGDETGCPVILFIHGGNYRRGSASPYGGQLFTQKDTILVVPQYRLGSLGYLSTNTTDASGNLGLFDIVAAKAWIQDYIEFFGGDPKRVTLMGHGSGGSAASVLSMTRAGRDTTGVAALSGTPVSPGAVRSDPASHADAVAEKTGCPKQPAERLVKCLRKLPAEKIILADNEVNMDGMDTMQFLQDISGRSGAGARVEGTPDLRSKPPIITDQPANSLKKKQKRPPLLTGVTTAETGRAVFGRYSQFLTDKLQNVNDFIKKDLIGGLQGVMGSVEGLLPGPAGEAVKTLTGGGALPLADYYQTVFDTSKAVVGGLAQVVEATGDALFNFPAYETVNAWSSGGSAFLYSFEHRGNLTKGHHFLPGMALTDPTANGSQIKDPTHGDELAYLFVPQDEEGKPIDADNQMSEMDAKVRNSFVDLVAKFAHSSKDETKKGSEGIGGLFKGLSSFSSENDQFLKINDGISVDKGFRFCQMGIWGNKDDRLTGALCKNLITDLVSQVASGQLPLGQLDKVLPVGDVVGGLSGGLFGGLGGMKPTATTRGLTATNRRPIATTRRPSATTRSRNNLLPFDF